MPLHLLVKWVVVSPNSREGQLQSISNISSIHCSDFVSQMRGWFGGGGGVMFFSYFMLFTTFLEKNNLAIHLFIYFLRKTIISHLMFSSYFIMLEILKNAPSLTG